MEIKEAIKLEDGGTYCIEYEQTLSREQREKIRDTIDKSLGGRGIKLLILDGGAKLARADK